MSNSTLLPYERISVVTQVGGLELTRAITFLGNTEYPSSQLLVDRVPTEQDGQALAGKSYRVHGDLARDLITGICEYACEYWPDTAYHIELGEGDLNVGEHYFLLAILAPSHQMAMDAADYLLRTIQKRIPVWFKNRWPDGSETAWVPMHDEQVQPLGV